MRIHFQLTLMLLLAMAAASQQNAPTATPPGPRPNIDPDKVTRLLATYAALGDKSYLCATATASLDQTNFCEAARNFLDPRKNEAAFAEFVLKLAPGQIKSAVSTDTSAIAGYLAQAAATRIDSQAGAPPSASGSVNAVERAGIGNALGVALEAGAVTQSVSGSTLTLQGNGLSLYRFLTHQDIFPIGNQTKSLGDRILSALSTTATLNITSSGTQPVSGTVAGATGSAAQAQVSALNQNTASRLTSFTLDCQLHNKFDIRSPMYLDAWSKAFSDQNLLDAAKALNTSASALHWLSVNQAIVGQWYADALSDLSNTLRNASGALADPAGFLGPKWMQLADTANQVGWIDQGGLAKFLAARDTFLNFRTAAINNARLQVGTSIDLQYVYSKPQNQPHTSAARFIMAEHLPGAAKSASSGTANDNSLTLNLASEFYDNPPAGTGVLKDLQAAFQVDHHFGSTIATVAGYYQQQYQPSALQIGPGNLAPNTDIQLPGSAATLLAPKGHIWIVQGKLTFSMPNGATVPVGITWASRTDLINAPEVRGHVGIDFDWTSLFAGNGSKH